MQFWPRTRSLLLILLLSFTLFACTSGEDDPAIDGDAADGDVADGDTDGDVPDGDAPDGDTPDGDTPDGDTPDGDVDGDADGDEVCEPIDEVPQDTPDAEQKKFALSMYHFNVQYVAGGLEVEEDGEMTGLCGPSCIGWDDARLIDWIITETFEPVLDLYLAHPGWRVTFEMQAMMMEAIGERHPELLVKLRAGAQSGQIELVSFHYSAQLFLAFPLADHQRSVDMTKAIFAKYCVPLSGVVFNQEGQAGEGKHEFMAANDYTISVFPKNLFRYVQYEVPQWPWYKNRGVDVIVGPGAVDPDSGIEVNWTFFDDGELLAYPMDPYFAPFSNPEKRAERLEEYAQKLTALENDGFKVTSITDYVNHLRAQQIEQPELPAVIDGTWQPTSTDSLLRWMGGRSDAPYNEHERDNEIRTENYRISRILLSAEKLLDALSSDDIDTADLEADLHEAWRHLFLAEVTDATGITPWIGEFKYATEHNAAARQLGERIIQDALTAADWPVAEINLESGSVTRQDDIPIPEAPDSADAPLEVTVTAPTRDTEAEWFDAGDNAWELQFTYGPAADTTGNDEPNSLVSLAFPRTENMVQYSPALIEHETVRREFSDFTFQKTEIYLPLANGLIGLGNDWWLVKDCRYTHVAARVNIGASSIDLVDETANPADPQMWRVFIVHGTQAEALAFARKTNTHPLMYFARAQN